MKMYIAVLDVFPVYMTPTLVAHAVLGHHLQHNTNEEYTILYNNWLVNSFKKCILSVNQKEFDKISALPNAGLFHENNTLDAKKSCCVIVVDQDIPNVLKFAKLWKETKND